MIVIDASAALALVVGVRAGPLLRRLADEELCAPHLIDLEVTQVLRRWTRGGVLTVPLADRALATWPNLPLKRYPHLPLMDRIWALRPNLSAYDAAYVALAESLDAPLITRDSRIATAPGHRARVELS